MKLKNILKKWKIKINSSKTEAILLKQYKVNFDGQCLAWNDKVKYLDVILNKK